MKRMLVFLSVFLLVGSGCSSSTTATRSQVSSFNDETELRLHGKGLTSIPAEIFSRTRLEKLDLSDNRLTGAPQAEIRQLRSLKTLDLSGNRLTGLPAEIGQLTSLETLDVSNNKLTGLPLELGNLTQLRLLDVSGNPYSTQDLKQIAAKLPNTEIRR